MKQSAFSILARRIMTSLILLSLLLPAAPVSLLGMPLVSAVSARAVDSVQTALAAPSAPAAPDATLVNGSFESGFAYRLDGHLRTC